MTKELAISKKDLDLIQEEMRVNRPYEACGVIIGTVDGNMTNVEKVIPVTNIRQTTVSFELDPQEVYNAWKDAEKNGSDIVGTYHTHPSSSATPSSWDRETMKNVHLIWLIAGVNGIWGYVYEDGIEYVKMWVK